MQSATLKRRYLKAVHTSPTVVEAVALPQRATRAKRPALPGKFASDKALPAIRRAARQYKAAYKDLYGFHPILTYDGRWIRIAGTPHGISLTRLKELTQQLINRKG